MKSKNSAYNIMMNSSDEKRLYKKIYIVNILSGAIVIGLVFLLVSGTGGTGGHGSAAAASASSSVQTQEPVTVTASPYPSADTVTPGSLTQIVNRNHMIDASYVPDDLVTVDFASNGEQQLRSEAAAQMRSMFVDASAAGISLELVSGYRSYEQQTSLYNYYTENLGSAEADRIDAYPGASEHQIGLTADLGTTDNACTLEECFGQTEAYQWLKANSYKYGYIERDPEGKEAVTGIKYSPWNYRYVGIEEAAKIYQSGLTMEEYYGVN
jgi:D-alanyl-D-alanine carboxypeptidase